MTLTDQHLGTYVTRLLDNGLNIIDSQSTVFPLTSEDKFSTIVPRLVTNFKLAGSYKGNLYTFDLSSDEFRVMVVRKMKAILDLTIEDDTDAEFFTTDFTKFTHTIEKLGTIRILNNYKVRKLLRENYGQRQNSLLRKISARIRI